MNYKKIHFQKGIIYSDLSAGVGISIVQSLFLGFSINFLYFPNSSFNSLISFSNFSLVCLWNLFSVIITVCAEMKWAFF